MTRWNVSGLRPTGHWMLTGSFALAYALVAAFCVFATLLEGRRHGARWDMMRIAGLGLCVFWPLIAVVLIVLPALQRRARPGVLPSSTVGSRLAATRK